MDIFGDFFDLNGDGELDAMEQAAQLGFVAQLMEDEEDEEDDSDDRDDADDWGDSDDD